jgi:hypothetical protein
MGKMKSILEDITLAYHQHEPVWSVASRLGITEDMVLDQYSVLDKEISDNLPDWVLESVHEAYLAGESDQSVATRLEIDLELVEDMYNDFRETEDSIRDVDDSMDGDHASALASAGFGTDEDYGYYGDSEY